MIVLKRLSQSPAPNAAENLQQDLKTDINLSGFYCSKMLFPFNLALELQTTLVWSVS